MNTNYEEEFIERVEKAAHKGAKSGCKRGNSISSIISVVLIIAVFFFVSTKIDNFKNSISNLSSTEQAVEGHDLTLENHRLFGYTAADFAEAILGKDSQLIKLEAYKIDISDAATITQAGLGKLKVFSKTQIITYNGTATYTVDLSNITESDIQLDEENNNLIIYIPHTKLESINIPRKNIHFGDTEKGFFAIGELKLTTDENAKVETEAETRMKEKLVLNHIHDRADEAAIMSVWKLYQPIISSVSPAYTLEIRLGE